jgi:hypothetical protein
LATATAVDAFTASRLSGGRCSALHEERAVSDFSDFSDLLDSGSARGIIHPD